MPTALARWRAALPCAALILLCSSTSASAEVMRGTPKADRLIGSAAADTLRGRAGADVLDGRGGNDRIFGDRGNDRIAADGGDLVVAGPGADRIAVAADRLAFRVACGAGRDRLTVSAAAGLSKRAVRERTSGCERVAVEDGAAAGADHRAGATPRPRRPDCRTVAPSVPQGMAWTTNADEHRPALGRVGDDVGVTGYRIYRNGTPGRHVDELHVTAAAARATDRADRA